MGNTDYRHCVVFNSLSKRSSLPGLRSGFIAGDAAIIQQFYRYRTYHGCAMPLPIQYASVAAWQDEEHVIENREQYRQSINDVYHVLNPVLSMDIPAGGFFLWPETPLSIPSLHANCLFNSILLYYLDNICRATLKVLIQVSTECVWR